MINKVILVGNVGADPEVRSLEGGAKVARLNLATTERIFNRDKNETTEHTEWHTVVLWRGLADVADKYIRKGSQLYIEGKLKTREYEKDGTKRYATEVVAEELKMLGKRESQPAPAPQVQQTPPSSPTPQVQQTPPSSPTPPTEFDDMPF